jgi:hypothetical protein
LSGARIFRGYYSFSKYRGGTFWEELKATSKLLSSTHFNIKGNCSLKTLKLESLKYYAGENTMLQQQRGH